MGTMFVSSANQFYTMRFLLGAAEAGFFPGIIYYLTLWYPMQLRSTRLAWFVSAVAVAGVIGNPLSGAIIDGLSGAWGLEGWRWLFLIEGAPSVLVGVWVLGYLDSSVAQAGWLTPEEKAVITTMVEAEDAAKPCHRLRDAFANFHVYVLCLIYFTLTVGLYGIAFWLPTIVSALGQLDYLSVGLISAIPYGAAVVGMVIIGRHSDRTGERRLHYAANISAGAAGLILSGVFASDPVASVIALSIATIGVIGSIPLFWPMPQSFLAGPASAAGIAVINSFGNLGGYVGPHIPVWARQYSGGPSAALYAFAAILMLGAAMTLALDTQRQTTDA
jgi:MFS family permease